jgi:hypothetical protein
VKDKPFKERVVKEGDDWPSPPTLIRRSLCGQDGVLYSSIAHLLAGPVMPSPTVVKELYVWHPVCWILFLPCRRGFLEVDERGERKSKVKGERETAQVKDHKLKNKMHVIPLAT